MWPKDYFNIARASWALPQPPHPVYTKFAGHFEYSLEMYGHQLQISGKAQKFPCTLPTTILFARLFWLSMIVDPHVPRSVPHPTPLQSLAFWYVTTTEVLEPFLVWRGWCTCSICSYCHHSFSYNRLLYSYQHRLGFLMYFADTGLCCYLVAYWKLYWLGLLSTF